MTNDYSKLKSPPNRLTPIWVVGAFLVVSLTIGIILTLYISHLPTKSPITEGEHIEKDEHGYWVVDVPTPNVTEGTNDVEGIILHHTATANGEQALKALTSPRSGVSCHVLIDTDGTRYVLADPTQITWHAGKSTLNGRDGCNNFTVGIEFQGNTVEQPLTDDQIESAIDYVLPIMRRYSIPMKNIVTHEMIRRNFKEAHPKAKAHAKVDVTPEEHDRFIKALRRRMRTEIFPNFKSTTTAKSHV